jgi:hypothetical protein
MAAEGDFEVFAVEIAVEVEDVDLKDPFAAGVGMVGRTPMLATRA